MQALVHRCRRAYRAAALIRRRIADGDGVTRPRHRRQRQRGDAKVSADGERTEAMLLSSLVSTTLLSAPASASGREIEHRDDAQAALALLLVTVSDTWMLAPAAAVDGAEKAAMGRSGPIVIDR